MKSSAAQTRTPEPGPESNAPARSGADVDEAHNLQIAPGNGVVPCDRYPVDLPVTLRWNDRDRRRTAVDVSEEGLFVESPDHVAAGELVQLVVGLPGGETIRALCTVERVVMAEEASFCGGMPGMGLRFFLMDSSLRTAWSTYLEQLRTGTVPEPADPDRSEHVKDVPLIQLTRRNNNRRRGRFRVRMKSQKSLEDFYTRNVSKGGMFISTQRPLTPGKTINLFVVHPVTGREYSLEAQVRWCRSGDDPGMGVQILDQSEADEQFLKFVNEG
jgi:uncharacterized protein (TIGR02266 family)